jgi:hypothetical protein
MRSMLWTLLLVSTIWCDIAHAAQPYLGNGDDVELVRQATSQRPPQVIWNGKRYDVYNNKNIPSGKMINADDPSDIIPTPFVVLDLLEVPLSDYQRKKVLAAEEKQNATPSDDKGCCIIL